MDRNFCGFLDFDLFCKSLCPRSFSRLIICKNLCQKNFSKLVWLSAIFYVQENYYYYYHYYYYCYYYYYYFNFVSHFIKTIFENRRIAFVKKCLQRGFQFLKIISSKVLFTNQPSFIYKEKFGIVTKIKLVTHAISKDLKIFDYSQ